MKKFGIKSLALLVCVTLLLTFAVSGTVAFLADNSGPVVNEFAPVSVPPSVEEDREGNVKSNVKIKNNGNIDAYIRAMVVVTWQDSEGNVYPKLPVETTDYAISYGSGWTKIGNFYYYEQAVGAGELTTNLIVSCTPKNTEPNGYTLHVEILAQSIQAAPDTAVQTSWGVTISNGAVTPVN